MITKMVGYWGWTILLLSLFSSSGCSKKEEEKTAAVEKGGETEASLADDTPTEDLSQIKWVTNLDEKPIAAEGSKSGGVWREFIRSYPLTFRLYGPNSNDAFANWNRDNCFYTMVTRHPNTLEHIPLLATHWAVMPDQKTLYYKLDPDAQFNDGHRITADDYVFAYKMMLSKEVTDPFYNKYYGERIEGVYKISKYVVKIVGRRPSWRALDEYQIYPIAEHATQLDENWVKRANWQVPICPGPYKIGDVKQGRYVKFDRVKNWWGDKKKYLKGRFNFDQIDLRVIRDTNLAFERFKKGQLSSFQVLMASMWSEKTDFEAVQKGWVVKKRVFNQSPDGMYAWVMNLEEPLFQDINIRKALQHLFDFDKINKKLMYGAYLRKVSNFTGSEYASPRARAYPYDPKKARDYLVKSGWTQRGPDGILVKDGKRLSFVFTFGSAGFERHLSVYQEDLKAEGIEMKLKLVDGATSFKYGLQRNYQMTILSRTTGLNPDPEQYFHSSFAKVKDNNNIFAHADPKIDELIKIYNESLDKKERLKAMHQIDEAINDKAFVIHAWTAPFVRMLYWNRYGHPKSIIEKTSTQVNESYTFFYNPEKAQALEKAMKAKQVFMTPGAVDYDPFQVRE